MTENTNTRHLEALDQLGFVHRRLALGDVRNGTSFVPADQFNARVFPNLIATVTADETRLAVYADELLYEATFSPSTPANVVNQAFAAAMANRS